MKYILIITLIIMFVPPIRRFVFQLLVGRQLVKEQKRQAAAYAKRREGEIRVENHPTKSTNSPYQRGGEYVDYEEVK
ncbi:DUF4834 domain-containing protein [Spirosoma arcticum]